MSWFRKQQAPLVVDSIDDDGLRAIQEDNARIMAESRAIQGRIRSQWGVAIERFNYTTERLDENDLAGALDKHVTYTARRRTT